MTLTWVIYLIENITNLKGSFWDMGDVLIFTCLFWITVHFIGTFVVFIGMEWSLEEFKDSFLFTVYTKALKWWVYTAIPMAILGSLLNILIPSQNTTYKMLAAYGVEQTVQAASQSEDVKRIAKKSLLLVEDAVDNYTKQLQNDTHEDQKVEQNEKETQK